MVLGFCPRIVCRPSREFRTNNREFHVVQSGESFLHLKDPVSFPAGPAVFELTIDGEVTQAAMPVDAVSNSIEESSAQMVAEP